LTYTNNGSAGSTIPTPTGCGGSSPFQGGYAGGDVWFEVTVPASGSLDIHTQAIDFTDGAMALYSGSCGSPVLVECDDDGEPGDGILMPHIYATGLTPGATMFVRVWEYGNNNNGEFGICVSTPDNDDCANAQQICDLNGYGGITSSAYTIDQPSNMCGIGDPLSPNPACVFGTGYTGVSPVQIDNNSWLQFTASSTTAELFVDISSCANGNGLQMQIFEGTNCTNFTAVSNFLETTTSQTVLATGLTPGNTYYIVVDGFAGDICSYTISATSGVQVVEAIAIDDQLCLGENTNITAQVTGTGSYTYTWSSDPAGTYPNTSTINVSPTVTTEYTVDITGLCGTTTSASVLVTVNSLPTANAGMDQTICDGSNATLSASGGTSYNWTGLGTGQSQTVSPNSNTNYVVTVTDANGCQDTDDLNVTVNPTPTANAGPNEEVCTGSSITLTASGGGNYNWGSGFSSNPNNSVSPTSNTTYTVTVENGFGCQDTDDVIVTVNSLPNAFAGNDITVCNGGTTTLSASGGVSYDWDDPGLMDAASQTIGPLTSSVTYVVTVTDGNNCVNTDDITITVGSALIPDAGPDSTVCLNDPLSYTASGGINYSWEDASGSTVSSNQNFTPSTGTVGSAWYYVTVDDGGSCSGEDSVFVTVNALPTANAGINQTICEGDSVTITGSGGTNYDWDNGLGSGISHVVMPTSNTTYELTISDANGCIDVDQVTVSVNPLPTIVASADQAICEGNSANISANGGSAYSWNNSLGSGQNQNVSPSLSTTYIVIGTDGNNCSNTDSVLITVNTLPVIDTSSIQIEAADCINGGGTISGIAVIGNPNFSYDWSDGSGSIGSTLSVGGLNPGNYILTVNDGNGCESLINVTVDFIDLSSLYANNDTIATSPATLTSIYAYANDTGDVNTIQIITPPANGTASVGAGGYIDYTSNAGFFGVDSIEYEICDVICTNACERAWIIITVNERLPIDLPNGFSPNGDGYNDYFVIENIDQYPENEILIFNRWGDQVYSAAPYGNDWDGSTTNAKLKVRGNKVVDGTYSLKFLVLKT
jgi:gliding motility-associated-like protein